MRGSIRTLIIGAAVVALSTHAQAQTLDLSTKLDLIESIQRQENAKPPLDLPHVSMTLPGGQTVRLDGPCVSYAGSKIERLAAIGIPAHAEIVQTEPDRHGKRALHMVVEIDATLRGKPVEMVLESRPEFPGWTTKAQLIRQGYVWDYGAAMAADQSNPSEGVKQ